jgi:hypothetical protein
MPCSSDPNLTALLINLSNFVSNQVHLICLLLQLLELIEPLKRGLVATEEDQAQIEGVVQQLERMNPTPKPLESPLLNGRWRLVRACRLCIRGLKEEFCQGTAGIWGLRHTQAAFIADSRAAVW